MDIRIGYSGIGTKPMPDTVAILRAARAKIRARKRWARGFFAYTKTGAKVWPTEKSAASWCAWGAVKVVTADHPDTENPALHFLLKSLPRRARSNCCGISAYNDGPRTTHADILALFDRAIAAAEREKADA